MDNAQPGDTLTMSNGIWTNEQITFKGDGVKGDSILLRVETPGHVLLTGNSRLSINGTYLKVDGLRFVGGYNSDSAIEFEGGSHHCRVTNTQVSEYNPPRESIRYHWIVLKGSHHRLDHCYFSGKRHSGVTMLVSLSSSPYGFHRIDHNHFAEMPEGNGNGYESLKVAAGDYSDLEGNIVAEYNYFYRCNGEIEIISNKCHNNTYRFNTFVECKGTLTLRQGMYCTVYGNYFFGNGIANTGGIRITHRGHKIFNNYFQNLGGSNQRSAITLFTGMEHDDYVPGDGGHVRADSILIAHNTIVNCAGGIYSGYFDDDDLVRYPPRDNIYANNIITMDNSTACFKNHETYPGENQFWEGNLLNGTNIGDVPDLGFLVSDPKLEFSNGWYQISGSSPAVNAGVGNYSMIIDDIDGIIRDESKDIGADELGSGSRQPLTSNDVGPDWMTIGGQLRFVIINLGGTGSGKVILDPPGGIYEQGTSVTLTAIPDQGNTFKGWSGDIKSTENPVTIIMESDKGINAEFIPQIKYTLAVWSIGSGLVEFDPPGGAYAESTIVRIHAIPNDGWEFSHWDGAIEGENNPDSVLMDSDKAFMAYFVQAVSVDENEHQMPMTYRLDQNYPNPFNPETFILFSLEKPGFTTLSVYDVLGHKVADIVKCDLNAGIHRVNFKAYGLASGVYFYKIQSGEFTSMKKMILTR